MRQDSTGVIPSHTDVPQAGGHSLSADCARAGKVLSRIGDKWSVMVVILLREGPKRFSELKREIGAVSQRMLTLTLRGLERDGLLTRTVFPIVPPRVDYELTELGHSLREPIEALGAWTFAHLDVIDAARSAFDGRQAGSQTAGEAAGRAQDAPSPRVDRSVRGGTSTPQPGVLRHLTGR